MRLFLPGRRFIPEVKRHSFLREKPSLFDIPDKSHINPQDVSTDDA